jgi:hypothetical protein
VHGLGSGTDRSTPWLLALFAGSVAAVLGAATLRVRGRSRALAGGVAAAGVAIVVLLAIGPLRFTPKPWNASSFDASITGRVVQNVGATRGLVSAAATADGAQRALIRADLLLEPRRLDATSFQLEYLPSGLLCTGHVVKVQSLGFDARCKVPDGSRQSVHASWVLGQASTFTGNVRVRPS